MTSLAPTLEAFFTDRLARQHHASANTVSSYRDTFRLLLDFAQHTTGKAPCRLDIADLDAPLIGSFLNHLEEQRHNSVRTRNARLAAIHSLFGYAALRHPEHGASIQRVLAIPTKRFDRALITYLTETEADALLAAPDLTTWTGRRDRVLLLVALQTGLRVSEMIGLTGADVHFGAGAHVACHGKGRKDRITPLRAATIDVVRIWLAERAGEPNDPVFPTRTGHRLSRDAIEHRIALHAATATAACPSLRDKNVTAHVLRHSAAMRLLEQGVDTTVIALARPRAGRHDLHLPPRRPQHQRTSPRPHKTTRRQTRPLPPTRRPPRLPRRTLIMPTTQAPESLPHTLTSADVGIIRTSA